MNNVRMNFEKYNKSILTSGNSDSHKFENT